VTDGVGVFGGVHKGFGPPGPGAHEETESESSVNYEVGGRYAGSSVYAQLVGFYNDYDNILGKATLSTGDPTGSGETFNGGAVVVRGVEVSLEYDPLDGDDPALKLPLRLAYTYTDAEFRSDFESDYIPWGKVNSGDELPYIARHQFSASLGAEWRSAAVRLGIEVVDEMRTEAGRGAIPVGQGTDAHTLLSLKGEYDLNQRSEVFFGVQNLTDETYVVARRPAGARPGLPRTVLAGIRLSH
jgi:Fe(3+) dicitrate transport protein